MSRTSTSGLQWTSPIKVSINASLLVALTMAADELLDKSKGDTRVIDLMEALRKKLMSKEQLASAQEIETTVLAWARQLSDQRRKTSSTLSLTIEAAQAFHDFICEHPMYQAHWPVARQRRAMVELREALQCGIDNRTALREIAFEKARTNSPFGTVNSDEEEELEPAGEKAGREAFMLTQSLPNFDTLVLCVRVRDGKRETLFKTLKEIVEQAEASHDSNWISNSMVGDYDEETKQRLWALQLATLRLLLLNKFNGDLDVIGLSELKDALFKDIPETEQQRMEAAVSGMCPHCHEIGVLDFDGKIPFHIYHLTRCPGSDCAPVEEV